MACLGRIVFRLSSQRGTRKGADRVKIVINPKYTHLADFIEALPRHNAPIGAVLRDFRNILQKVSVGGEDLVVKQYKRPTLLNRIVYSFFRKSKARRSYEYALRLHGMGVDSPEPVAYIETRKNGLFHIGYFVSVCLKDPMLDSIGQYDPLTQHRILTDFAEFTVDLHRRGIMHYDYNPSNIFFREVGGSYRFALIDINRMRFKKPSKKKCLQSLQGLSLPLPLLVYTMGRYCELRGWNVEFFSGALLLRRGGFSLKHKTKHHLKLQIQKSKHFFQQEA